MERPGRFLAAGLLRRGGATAHRLRGSGLIVNVRHGSRDLAVFREIFAVNPWPNVYEPPPEVDAIVTASSEPRIVDLGANVLFGLYALGRWPAATIASFEPDPANLPLLRGGRCQPRAVTLDRARRGGLERRRRAASVAGLHAHAQLAGIGDPAARAKNTLVLARRSESRWSTSSRHSRDTSRC